MGTAGQNVAFDVLTDINYFDHSVKVIETKDWKSRVLGEEYEHTQKVTVHNIRGKEDTVSLDQNGFQFIELPKKQRQTNSDELIQQEYYPEVADVLKKLTNATTVHVFNHCLRQCSDPSLQGLKNAQGQWQVAPSGHPHVDYSGRPQDVQGTQEELQRILPADIMARFKTASRFAFLNAWRPLQTVRRDPLAVADASSVPEEDYVVRARKFRWTGVRSGNYVLSNGGTGEHRWYYLHEMRPEEMVVFKGYDTNQELPGWRCPHTAFVIPGTERMPPRESIEVRAVLFWD